MPYSIFKGNKKNTGAAALFTIDSKNQALFVKLIKQNGYDENARLPIFKQGQYSIVVFNINEMGGLIHAIETETKLNLYHQSAKQQASINFGPYSLEKDSQGNPLKPYAGFGLSVSITPKDENAEKLSFKVSITFSELQALKAYILYTLTHCFNSIYSEDVRQGKERAAKRNEGKKVPQSKEDLADAKSINESAKETEEELF